MCINVMTELKRAKLMELKGEIDKPIALLSILTFFSQVMIVQIENH